MNRTITQLNGRTTSQYIDRASKRTAAMKGCMGQSIISSTNLSMNEFCINRWTSKPTKQLVSYLMNEPIRQSSNEPATATNRQPMSEDTHQGSRGRAGELGGRIGRSARAAGAVARAIGDGGHSAASVVSAASAGSSSPGICSTSTMPGHGFRRRASSG